MQLACIITDPQATFCVYCKTLGRSPCFLELCFLNLNNEDGECKASMIHSKVNKTR